MDPKFQSSFIPKGPMPTAGGRAAYVDKGDRSFFGFISLIIFIITVVLSVGVFAYQIYLNSQIAQMGSDLTSANATLDPSSINQMVALNARIVSVQDLLSHHVVLSPLFAFLESSTISSVRLTDFTYSVSDKGILQVIIKGNATGYADIAEQADVLSKTPYLSNIVFSDLTLNAQGQVNFTVSADVSPTLVSYQKEIQGLQATLPPVLTTPLTVGTSTVAKIATSTTATKTNGSTTSPQAH